MERKNLFEEHATLKGRKTQTWYGRGNMRHRTQTIAHKGAKKRFKKVVKGDLKKGGSWHFPYYEKLGVFRSIPE